MLLVVWRVPKTWWITSFAPYTVGYYVINLNLSSSLFSSSVWISVNGPMHAPQIFCCFNFEPDMNSLSCVCVCSRTSRGHHTKAYVLAKRKQKHVFQIKSNISKAKQQQQKTDSEKSININLHIILMMMLPLPLLTMNGFSVYLYVRYTSLLASFFLLLFNAFFHVKTLIRSA